MSTKTWDQRITTRYTEPDRQVYEKIIELVKKNSVPKSTAQLLLVKRGLQHTQNPEPIIKTVVKEVPVEKIVEKVVYKSSPKVDKSTPQEHVGIEKHITGDLQNAGQRASADKLTTRDKADPPSSPALETKKSAKEQNGISGWAIGGGLGLLGLLLYLILKPTL